MEYVAVHLGCAMCYICIDFFRNPTKIIAAPAGYFMAPVGENEFGDVSNVLFSNGWIVD
jgi:4-O-beta-D-mannosyl-D-glucose phosphorylase